MKLKKNFYSVSLKTPILGKSYTIPGNTIAKDTADEKYFLKHAPDAYVSQNNLGNYVLNINVYLLYKLFKESDVKRKKGKRKQNKFLNRIEIDVNSTCTNNRQVPIPQANNFRCLVYLQNI